MELITKLHEEYNEYVNDLTKEMDNHLIESWKGIGYLQTYIYSNVKVHGVYAIRFPGATRGHIEADDNDIITNIVLYEQTGWIYKPEIKEIIKKYLGAKITFKE